MKFVGGVFSYEEAGADEDGIWCDWWLIEDLQYPLAPCRPRRATRVTRSP